VLRVAFPEVRVLGHPGLAAAFLVLLPGTRAARHGHPATGIGRGPADGVVRADEPGRPAVAGAHSAVGEATVHADVARTGADHSIGADNRAVAGRVTDEVLAEARAASAATGAGRVARTASAASAAGAAGAAGKAADGNRIGALAGNAAWPARIGTVTGHTTGRARITATRQAAGRNRIGTITRNTAQPAGITITRQAAGRNRIGTITRNTAGRNWVAAIARDTTRRARIATVTDRPARVTGAGIARSCSGGQRNRTDGVWSGGPARGPAGNTTGGDTGAGSRAGNAAAAARGKAGQGGTR